MKRRINVKKVVILMILIFVIMLLIGSLIQKPKVDLIGEKMVIMKLGDKYKENGVIAKVHNKSISDQVEIKGKVDTSKVGEYTIDYCLKNKVYQTRKIQIIDDIQPKINLKGNKIVNLKYDDKYTEEGYTAEDNYDGDLTDKVTVEKEEINKNEYKLLYKVQDTFGNKVEEERVVIKNDKQENKNIIYLTFDDGPSLDITPQILDILKEENVKATFFILDYNDKKKEIIKREKEEGHSIGIHGKSHNYKEIYKSLESGINNFTYINQKLKNDIGVDTKIIRFPGGSSNTVSKFNPGIMTKLTMNLLEKGYKYYDWNVSSGDSGDVRTKDGVYRNVTKQLQKGKSNIILMHDFAGNTKTLNALRDIIKYGKENNYIFEKISEETPMVTQKILN